MSQQRPKRKVLRDLALAGLLLVGLFALLEGGLRLTGIGRDLRTSPLAYQEVYPPAMVPARAADGSEFLRTWDPRHPYQVLPGTKAPNSLRVLCFGGSATAGLGFSPNVTFARQLRDLLEEAYPSRQIEVINLGVVAIAAKQVRLLVEDAAAHLEPDLMLVWSGNNEFLPVHHRKWSAARATWRSELREGLGSLNLVRALRRAVHGPPSPADVPDRDPDQDDDERLTQARIIQEVSLGPGELDEVLQDYADQLAGMAQAAQQAGVPIVISGVAVNEEWRGKQGWPEGWRSEFFGSELDWDAAVVELQARLADDALSDYDRWDLLTRLARSQDQLGRGEEANATWIEALALDPHLRRATPAHVEAARQAVAAAGDGVAFLDAPAAMRVHDPQGRVGFRHFYDYVHFTPRGACLAATAFFNAALELPQVPRPEVTLAQGSAGLPLVLEQRLERIEQLGQDFPEQDEFLGIGFDPARLQGRDLWKYDRALEEIEARLRQDPDDLQALLYRGCARAFRQGGAPGARADWERVLALAPDQAAAQANIEALPPVPAPPP